VSCIPRWSSCTCFFHLEKIGRENYSFKVTVDNSESYISVPSCSASVNNGHKYTVRLTQLVGKCCLLCSKLCPCITAFDDHPAHNITAHSGANVCLLVADDLYLCFSTGAALQQNGPVACCGFYITNHDIDCLVHPSLCLKGCLFRICSW